MIYGGNFRRVRRCRHSSSMIYYRAIKEESFMSSHRRWGPRISSRSKVESETNEVIISSDVHDLRLGKSHRLHFHFWGCWEMLSMICDRSYVKWFAIFLETFSNQNQDFVNFIRKSLWVKSISVNSIEHVEWILLHVHLSLLHNRQPDIHVMYLASSPSPLPPNIICCASCFICSRCRTQLVWFLELLRPIVSSNPHSIYAEISLIRKIHQTLNEIFMLREINIETRNESFKLNRKSNSNRV